MISGGRQRKAERDEPAEPERRCGHVQEVDERLVPRPAAIERMAGERRHRQERKSGGKRQRLEPGVDRRDCRKHRPHSGDHRRGRHDAAEASRNRDVVDDAGHADEDDQKAPSINRTGTGPTAKRKKAAPAAVSKPAKKRKRARTSWTLGPLSAVREGTGGARPEPTPNAITPASVCPSSESTRHRTV